MVLIEPWNELGLTQGSLLTLIPLSARRHQYLKFESPSIFVIIKCIFHSQSWFFDVAENSVRLVSK